jgi:alkylhydroperoxidase family enzyme
MGHAEMILAVAGMNAEDVNATTCRLSLPGAGGTPAERAALAFARKQSFDPHVTDADIANLEHHFGRDRAWHVIWWASRCHYMTKVADAFQLPLEEGNPFEAMPGAKPPK